MNLKLVLLLPILGTLWGQPSRCSPEFILQTFNISTAEVSFASPVCPGLFAQAGSCVETGSLQTVLNSTVDWYRQRSLDALDFARLLQNATIYWQVLNGFYTLPSNSSNYFINLFISMKQFLSTYIQQFSDWLFETIQVSTQAIPTCFQAMANVSAGVFCGLSANNTLKFGPPMTQVPSDRIPFGVVANTSAVGSALQVCLPLLDTYCSLSYGISIINVQLPFNRTFNWADGAIPINVCQNLRKSFNCTTKVCNDRQKQVLVDLFYSNWIPFVPSRAFIDALAAYLLTFSNTTAFKPPGLALSGVGISLLNNMGQEGVNFYALGLGSAAPATTYFLPILPASLAFLAAAVLSL